MRRGLDGILLAALLTALSPGAATADDRPLSPAQIALFEANHLKEIVKPVVLEYSFRHEGGLGGSYDDKVTADIRTVREDGKKDVWIGFLTGDRRIDYAPALGFNGNPLLMYFLENDVIEMHQATGGSGLYFRNRIREAFVDRAEVKPVSFTLDGKALDGTEIVLTPFRNDPMIDRFPGFAEKTYHFILSDAVPGRIYRITTSVPELSGAPTAFAETMTYVGEHP